MNVHSDPHEVMARHLFGTVILLYKCHRLNAIRRYKRVSIPAEVTVENVSDAADFFMRERKNGEHFAYTITISAFSHMILRLNQSNRLFLLDAGVDFEKEPFSDFNIFTMEECFRQAEICLLQSPLSFPQPLLSLFPDLQAAIRLRSHPVPWITPLSDEQMRDEDV